MAGVPHFDFMDFEMPHYDLDSVDCLQNSAVFTDNISKYFKEEYVKKIDHMNILELINELKNNKDDPMICYFVNAYIESTLHTCISHRHEDLLQEVDAIFALAKNGDHNAQNYAGICFLHARAYFGSLHPVDRNNIDGVTDAKYYLEWFEKSAAQNNSFAQYYLGFHAVRTNECVAETWLIKSANQMNLLAIQQLIKYYIRRQKFADGYKYLEICLHYKFLDCSNHEFSIWFPDHLLKWIQDFVILKKDNDAIIAQNKDLETEIKYLQFKVDRSPFSKTIVKNLVKLS